MNTEFVPWGKTTAFKDAVKELRRLEINKSMWIGSVKLHGTNAGVQLTPNGPVAQSRNRIITPEDDNFGFARWVHENRNYFNDQYEPLKALGVTTIFGEWVGPGICVGNTAVCKLPRRIWAPFCDSRLALDSHDDIVPVPRNYSVMVDLDDLQAASAEIETQVADVEKLCPWSRTYFQVEGPGEGLVYWGPQGLRFKAKGLEHRATGAKGAAPITVDMSQAYSFAEFVLTPARLEQALREACGDEATREKTGDFLRWVAKDVLSECADEMAAYNVDKKVAARAISNHAKKWYEARL